MGDISELRGLIVIGTFLAVTLLLIGWMPYEFWTAGEQGRTIDVPDYFEGADLAYYNSTYHINLSEFEAFDYKFWGEEEFRRPMQFEVRKATKEFWNWHGDAILGAYWILRGHKMEWINREGITRGVVLTANEIQTDYDTEKNSSEYTMKCKHFYMKAFIIYNTTLFSNVSDAFGDLQILFGINWDQLGTAWNAWSLISSILFFRPIEGIPFEIMMLISISIWIASAYIAYILILRAIGAVFGGGGA